MVSAKNYLTPNKVAELLMVSPSAIRLWAEKGELKAMVTAGGHRRFKLEDIKQFAKEKNIQLNIQSQDKFKILIVDDEQLFSEYLKNALSFENDELNIEISHDGFDAGIKLKDFNPYIVLLDLKMPSMNGFQVCAQIKQDPLLQHIRVIAMTGDASENNVQRIIDAGAEACFAKPINIVQLIQQLNF